MTELKKAVVFDDAGFKSLQSNNAELQALAPAQQFEQAEFSTTPLQTPSEEALKPAKQQLFWWGGALVSLSVLALWQWGNFVADSWQTSV